MVAVGQDLAPMDGMLLLARLMMAGCFIPAAVTRVSNISGFSYQLWVKGMPYPSAVAAAVAVIEVFGPLALVLGFAPRLTASVLVGATVIIAGTLHRFWEVVGPHETWSRLSLWPISAGGRSALL